TTKQETLEALPIDAPIPRTIHRFLKRTYSNHTSISDWRPTNIVKTKLRYIHDICGVISTDIQIIGKLDAAFKSVFSLSVDTNGQTIPYKNRLRIVHFAESIEQAEIAVNLLKSPNSSVYTKFPFRSGNSLLIYNYAHLFILISSQSTILDAFYVCAHCGLTLLFINFDITLQEDVMKQVNQLERYNIAVLPTMSRRLNVTGFCGNNNLRTRLGDMTAQDVFCYKNVTFKATNFKTNIFLPFMFSEHVAENKYVVFVDKFGITGEISSKFMTCWAYQPYTLRMYYKPFSTTVWIYLSTFVVGLTTFCLIFLNIKLKQGMCKNVSLGYGILTFFAALLEKSARISRNVDNRLAFRFIFGVWVLQSIIVTQLYTSKLISSLIIPLPKKSISRFDELLPKKENRTEIILLSDALINLQGLFTGAKRKEIGAFEISSNHIMGFDTYTPQWVSGYPNMNWDLKVLGFEFFSIMEKRIRDWLDNLAGNDLTKSEITNPQGRLFNMGWEEVKLWAESLKSIGDIELDVEVSRWFNLLSRANIWIPRIDNTIFNITISDSLSPPNRIIPLRTSFMEVDLAKCGRTVHVEQSNKFKIELAYLRRKYYWLEFFESDEAIFSRSAGWSFLNTGESNYSKWLDWFVCLVGQELKR
ncbi:Glutamate [NMDA] receptor subunit 1, partial [Folsomia candida]